jgi:hypothetical protein
MLYKRCVKFWTACGHRRSIGKSAVTCSMLLLWLANLALAVSPELHQLLHQDAQNLSHQCLITQIKQHSLIAGAPAAITPVPPPAGLNSVCCAESQFVPSSDFRLSFSRGPPAAFSSNTVVG